MFEEDAEIAHHEIIIVGNYCHDTLVNPSGSFHELGGAPAYASSIFSALGCDYSVVAKVGDDFKYWENVDKKPRQVSGARTTAFIDDFTSGTRVARLKARCEPISPDDVDVSAEVCIASAVAGEIPPETILKLRKQSRRLLCDVQGMVRRFDSEGNVGIVRLEETAYASILPSVDFLLVSREEAQFLDLTELSRLTRILYTEDSDGCRVLENGKELRLKAFPTQVKDSSGAGDCFLAGFAYGLSRGFDAPRAARLANYCGALAVSRVGIPKLTRDDFADVL